jgi:RNA-binding protein
MKLTEAQKKFLRGRGHSLNPVVTVGDAGLTPAVLAELESALAHHELLKVKLRTGDRALRDEFIERIGAELGATLVQKIGYVALFYRENPEKRKIALPEG